MAGYQKTNTATQKFHNDENLENNTHCSWLTALNPDFRQIQKNKTTEN